MLYILAFVLCVGFGVTSLRHEVGCQRNLQQQQHEVERKTRTVEKSGRVRMKETRVRLEMRV